MPAEVSFEVLGKIFSPCNGDKNFGHGNTPPIYTHTQAKMKSTSKIKSTSKANYKASTPKVDKKKKSDSTSVPKESCLCLQLRYACAVMRSLLVGINAINTGTITPLAPLTRLLPHDTVEGDTMWKMHVSMIDTETIGTEQLRYQDKICLLNKSNITNDDIPKSNQPQYQNHNPRCLRR